MHRIILRSANLLVMVLIAAVSSVSPVSADDVSDVDQILCATLQATRCTAELDCQTSSPKVFNIPDFIEIDLVNKQLQTTKASGQNRVTPISSLAQENGIAYIQGMQGGRLFSLVIDEQSGNLTAVMASNGKAVSAFAVCTPLLIPSEK